MGVKHTLVIHKYIRYANVGKLTDRRGTSSPIVHTYICHLYYIVRNAEFLVSANKRPYLVKKERSPARRFRWPVGDLFLVGDLF